MTHDFQYDCIIIGGGSGGVRFARIAANLGAKVALIEKAAMGGTCVNIGCVPKKLFVYAGEYGQAIRDAAGYGWAVPQADHSWEKLREAKDDQIAYLNGIYEKMLDQAKVTTIYGTGRFISPHHIAITGQAGDERVISGQHIIVATGARPSVLAIPGVEFASVSDDMFYLKDLPKHAIVLGGGYIALEFACILHKLGVKVTVSYHGDLFLRGLDMDCRQHLYQSMIDDGIEILLNHSIHSLDKEGDVITAHCKDKKNGAALDDITADLVLMATGRKPNIEELNLELADIETAEGGRIVVNEQFETNIPYHYAIGDVINQLQLTPVAIRHGMELLQHIFKSKAAGLCKESIATAIFTQPNYSYLGYSEEQARQQYPEDIQVYKANFRPMRHALSGSGERCFMKMIVKKSDDKVIGLHMIGESAGEIIQSLAVAVSAGATKEDFDRTLAIHPTTAEEFVTMKA